MDIYLDADGAGDKKNSFKWNDDDLKRIINFIASRLKNERTYVQPRDKYSSHVSCQLMPATNQGFFYSKIKNTVIPIYFSTVLLIQMLFRRKKISEVSGIPGDPSIYY